MIGRLVWQSLAQRPGRSLLLLLGYGLGVGVTVALLSIGDALVEQSRDRDLLGGGDLVVVPAGIDLETLKTGGVSSLYFTVDQARFLYREILAGPRERGRIEAAAPWIDDALLYLQLSDTTLAVAARGQIPSRAQALGVGPRLLSGDWRDSEADALWMAPGDSALLAEIDAFHRPKGPAANDSTWAEWHYFNILSPDEESWLYLTYLVGGDLEGDAWGGQILANLVRRDGTERRFEDRREASEVRVSLDRPDLEIGASTVRLLEDGRYDLTAHVPAADGRGDTLSLQLTLSPIPRRYLPPVDVSPGGFTSGYVVPVLDGRSTGSLCAGSRCLELADAASYHDHNWGVWRRVTWDWGFARAGDLSILYGGVERDETGGGRFLFVVDSLGLRGVLPIREIEYRWSHREDGTGAGVDLRPEGFRLRADRGDDSLTISVSVDHLRTTPREEDGAFFHQMRGPATVRGRLLEESVDEIGSGFFETWTREGETATSSPSAVSELGSAIRSRMVETGAEYGIAYRDLATGEQLLLNPDEEFHAASMMKVPVMVRLYRMHDAGQLDLDAPIEVRNEFRSIYDGSVYSLTFDEDSDSTLYAMAGTELPTRELIDLMIARSSNLATNVLIELADPDSIAAMLDEFGAGGMKVLRGVEDIPAYRNGMNNTTTARGLLELLDALGSGRVATPGSTDEMIEILLGQEFNDALPAGLPDGVPVAHKTGWITAVDHDGGLVFPPGASPYVLVVLTSGVEDESVTRAAAADVSRLVWEWRQKRAPSPGE